MRLLDDALRLSPSDLSNHLSCRHLTSLDLAVARGQLARPVLDSKFLDLLRARGNEHEQAYVAALRARGLRIVDLSAHRALSEPAFEATRAAMADGADVVVQAPVGHDGFAGYADLLLRVEAPSRLGAWSYVAADTKLARETRGGTILQLCVYSEIVGEYQGRMPERFHVVTPGDPFVDQVYRLDDFGAYYRLVKERLRAAAQGTGADVPTSVPRTYPEPVAHCDICRWWQACRARRRQDDHLSLVAGIRRTQRAELCERGVSMMATLAALEVPLPFKPSRGSRESLTRVRNQAYVQVRGRESGQPYHELLPVEAEHGLLRLPRPSPGDIFLDLEGDPFVGSAGLEYLFGWAVRSEDGAWRYTGQWATDASSEKAAFEAFMAAAALRADGAHIYHYAPYEPAALKRLMGRYAVCEDALDRLLRGGALVDLYAIVRQSVLCSVERYSIKELEPFYRFTREVPLPEASQALREVEYLLETGQPPGAGDALRATVASYNRDDCVSAAHLRDWLETLRAQLVDAPRPTAPDPAPTPKVAARDVRVRALMERLTAGLQADVESRTRAEQSRWLLAQLLAFHRREEKAVWWDFYRLTDLDDEALADEKDALVGLEFVATVDRTKNTVTNRYRYPPQEADIPDEAELLTSATHKVGTSAGLDKQARTVDIKHRVATTDERPTTVLARKIYNTDVIADALFRLGEWVAEHGIEGEGEHRAARELLLRELPRLANAGAGLTEIRELAAGLDQSTLAIQGPPGSGKTYTGARIICELVAAGRTVGVCANSHKVIRHQIDAALEAAAKEGLALRAAHKVDAVSAAPGVVEVDTNDDALALIQSKHVDVVGGTAWLWTREDMRSAVDVLVVDEAGQMSLANALAISQAASSLVLLGDPKQLEQPLRGSHPDGAAVSALQHVLGDAETMPADRGVFLADTYRMHPAVCAFTSELFYQSRLRPVTGLERQAIEGPGPIAGSGLWYVPVAHEGNRNSAPEEIDAVVGLVRHFTDGAHTWTRHDGSTATLGLDDILIVAPYNAQVAAIRDAVSAGLGVPATAPRVGTVDRFQGQQAPIVIYSLTTSTPEDAPRGMEFLYSLNRLNVATSRARCAALVVGSPRLFEPDCQTPRQMKLANALCRFREMANRATL